MAALYQEAVSKGETLKLDTGDNEYVHAAVHHLDENAPPEDQASSSYSTSEPHEDSAHYDGPSEDAGYYYYYYPIKSFLDEITSQPTEEQTVSDTKIS